ncbi:MAG: hypothetical protein JWL66_581 [Sphingomonadales bacterium]|nr:hypothetical protein [Sphingomonadales bacterium]
MTPDRLLGMALLVALLLPSLVALGERRRLHDMFRALVAIGGLGFCWTTGGGLGLLLGLSAAVGTLIVVTAIVAFTQILWSVRLLSGGEIKQLASGAAWLTPLGAIAYILLALSIAIVTGLIARIFETRLRNEAALIASTAALLLVFAGG